MWANTGLLLIGHGSARYPDAGRAMQLHVEKLRRESRFTKVEAGLLNGTPSVAEALAKLGDATLHVVPFFMEDGYFTRVAVPAALGGRVATLCPPIGVNALMLDVILRQALAACTEMDVDPRGAAVLVAGHGSSSAPGRALALHRHAARLAEAGRFAMVSTGCLEEPPFIADVLSGMRAYPVVVIGFFAGEGGHVRDDVPALVAAEQSARGPEGQPVRFHSSVADDPVLWNVVLQQVMTTQFEEGRQSGRAVHPLAPKADADNT